MSMRVDQARDHHFSVTIHRLILSRGSKVLTDLDDLPVINLYGCFVKNPPLGVLRDYPIAIFQDQSQIQHGLQGLFDGCMMSHEFLLRPSKSIHQFHNQTIRSEEHTSELQSLTNLVC